MQYLTAEWQSHREATSYGEATAKPQPNGEAIAKRQPKSLTKKKARLKYMKTKDVALVSVYMDLAAGRRGVDMGPSAIRIAGLVNKLEKMGYKTHEMGAIYAHEPEICTPGENNLKYLKEVTNVCKQVKKQMLMACEKGWLPLVLGGDHSIAIGTVSGVAEHYKSLDQKIGLIWVDAHADMNLPETSPSGNIHGMPLAVLLGKGDPALVGLNGETPSVAPQNVTIIGARDIDESEKELVRQSGVRVFTMSEIDERGIAYCIDESIKRAMAGTCGFHLSFDLDSLDPIDAPGVGTPVDGGLSYREGHLICEKAARSGGLLSMEAVEVNPILDAHNRTAQLAVEIIESALGKTIL